MKHIVINIGRQFGSGGLAVARELGKKLCVDVYDSELITKAAQDSGFSAELFKDKDEKRHRFSFKSVFTGPVGKDYMSDNELFRMQGETIRKIAGQGSAVIVGRCADYILRDLDYTLNVFLTAPVDARVERICDRMGVSAEDAREIIQQKDEGRLEYYNFYTFGAWGAASTYDLCIDTSILGIEGTADFIISFATKAGLL
ncbi:MAG: AAA family ATPase [Candidatus Cryptobacteroides sp.]